MFRELTRKQQALSPEECAALLTRETRGVLCVNGDGGYPYGAPMNHYFEPSDGCIYFHCGTQSSHRLDALRACDKVSFCVTEAGSPKADHPWALEVRSVVVFGRMEVISDPEQVCDISARLSRKFTRDEDYIRDEIAQHGHRTLLLRLRPEHICGKRVLEA